MTKGMVLVFAGTTEGRRLAEYLLKRKVRVHICVATEYGESLLQEHENLTITHERMDYKQMMKLIEDLQPDFVVDATHPFAKEVTENIKRACKETKKSYLRLLRETMGKDSNVVYVDSLEAAVSYLEDTKGNILVSTGSKNIEVYTGLTDYQQRIYARVLSVKASLEKCEAVGIIGKHLICMQGPFSTEMNVATIQDFQIEWFVTKESGMTGGFQEKLEACERTGAKLVVIGRPEEESGYTYHKICMYLKEMLQLHNFWKVALVGIGMGTDATMTEEAKKACYEADLLIGAKRMLENAPKGKAVFISYRPEEILAYIKEHPEYEKVAILYSGDVGFYSGAKKQLSLLEQEEEIETKIISGISSGIYLCDQIGVSWEEVRFLSMHGREMHLISEVRKIEKLAVIVSNAQGIQSAMQELTDYGYGHLQVVVGSDLSYETESIQRGTVEELIHYTGSPLAVFFIENPDARNANVTQGIPDEAFIRGNVPMTKEEVRSVSISKMQLYDGAVVYDVGAGTGSVAIETAMRIPRGQVYAIERKQEALELIEKNQKKFGTDNVTIVSGEAPEALENLPAPEVVFVGGSGGNLDKIIDTVAEKNPRVRVVINAIALETVAEAINYMKQKQIHNEEIVQLQVSKDRKIGAYHMMTGQNPIYIISFTCGEEE